MNVLHRAAILAVAIAVGACVAPGAYSRGPQQGDWDDADWNGGWGGQGQGRSLTLYERPNFQGRSVTITDDVRDLGTYRFNDRAGSARTNGSWLLCEDNNYGGSCISITGDAAYLGRLAGEASSARRAGGWSDNDHGWPNNGHGWPDNDHGWPDGQGRSLTLYEGPNFHGQSVTITDNTRSLGQFRFNDRARSARTNGTWLLCEDENYGGRCVTISGDAGNLGRLAGEASSARRGGR